MTVYKTQNTAFHHADSFAQNTHSYTRFSLLSQEHSCHVAHQGLFLMLTHQVKEAVGTRAASTRESAKDLCCEVQAPSPFIKQH